MKQKKQDKANQEKLQKQITDRFIIQSKLGSGAYGHVWKVICRTSNKVYALKKVFSAFQNDVDAQRTYRQISLLKKLSHPNIIKLHDVIRAENNFDLYLTFDFVESDLFSAVRDDVLNDIHKKYIVYQLAKCLKYLHSAKVIHRDLKPSNVLIDENCIVRLCDMGLSRSVYKHDDVDPLLTEFIATRWYRAPQVLFGSRVYDHKADIWSLGCLVYELYAGQPLLPGDDSLDQIAKVLQFKGLPSEKDKASMKVDNLDFILSHFKEDKYSLDFYFKGLQHRKQLVELLNNLLHYNPNDRWSAEQILSSSFMQEFNNFEQEPRAVQPIKMYPNDNQKLSLEMYRNLIYKLFIKKQESKELNLRPNLGTQHSFTSKRGYIKQLKGAGSLHLGMHRSLNGSCHQKSGSIGEAGRNLIARNTSPQVSNQKRVLRKGQTNRNRMSQQCKTSLHNSLESKGSKKSTNKRSSKLVSQTYSKLVSQTYSKLVSQTYSNSSVKIIKPNHNKENYQRGAYDYYMSLGSSLHQNSSQKKLERRGKPETKPLVRCGSREILVAKGATIKPRRL